MHNDRCVLWANRLQAATRLKDLREEIVEALEEVPSIIALTNKASGIFRTSEDVQQLAAGLYVTMLDNLEHIVRYTEKAMSQSPLFQQENKL
jgi:hypothetical protein